MTNTPRLSSVALKTTYTLISGSYGIGWGRYDDQTRIDVALGIVSRILRTIEGLDSDQLATLLDECEAAIGEREYARNS